MDISVLRILGYGMLLLSHDNSIITAASMLLLAELINFAKKL